MAIRNSVLPIFVRKPTPPAERDDFSPVTVERRYQVDLAWRRSWSHGEGDDLREMHAHIRVLHPTTGDGFFVLASKLGPYTERMHRARTELQAFDVQRQQFVSMNRFKANRGGGSLASCGNLWLEFDPYAEDAQGNALPYRNMDRDELMALLFAAIRAAGLPAPSYWSNSGRGLHCVWVCEALPAKAAKKVQRVMDALYGPVLNADGTVPARRHADPDRDAQEARLAPMWRVFRDAGLDRGTQDSSRVLRLWGSWNPKSFSFCHRMWPSRAEDIRRCRFDDMADAVLPLTSVEFKKRMAERAAMPPKPVAAEQVEPRKRKRSANPYAGKMGVWERKASDLMRLREHRGRIEVGKRHLWVFLAANAYAQCKGGDPATWAELLAPLAGLTVADAIDCLKSLGRRQRQTEAGETHEHGGMVWTILFHYSGSRMASDLGVTKEEANAAGLSLVRPGLGKAIPPIERKRNKRIKDGAVSQPDRADAKLSAGRQGLALRAGGASFAEAISAIRAASGRGKTWAVEAMKLAAAIPVETGKEPVASAPEPRKSNIRQVQFSGRYIGGSAPAPAVASPAKPAPARPASPKPSPALRVRILSAHSTLVDTAPGKRIVVIEDKVWGTIAIDVGGGDAAVPTVASALPSLTRRRASRAARHAAGRIPGTVGQTASRPPLTADEYRRISKGH